MQMEKQGDGLNDHVLPLGDWFYLSLSFSVFLFSLCLSVALSLSVCLSLYVSLSLTLSLSLSLSLIVYLDDTNFLES